MEKRNASMRVKYLCEVSTVTSHEGEPHLMYAPRAILKNRRKYVRRQNSAMWREFL
jgi:hypothetical protein